MASKLRVDEIVGAQGSTVSIGTATFTGGLSGDITGLNVTGVITATTLNQNVSGGLNVTGNVNATGLSTFSSGLHVTGGSVGIGTDNPDAPLTIRETGDVQIRLKNSSGVTKAYLGTAGAFGTGSTDDLRIRSEGNILFGSAGSERMRMLSAGGLTFNGDTAAANALDDYEEGEWTPSAFLSYNPSSRSVSTTNSAGRYVKVGNLVTCYFRFTYTLTGSGGFNLGINNLPFTAKSGSYDYSGGGMAREDAYTGYTFFSEAVTNNTTSLQVLRRYDNGAPRDPTGNMTGSCSYMTD